MSRLYINRKITQSEEYYKEKDFLSIFRKSTSLYDILSTDIKRIVLLGDPGSGKSTELRTLQYRLIKEMSEKYLPIFVRVDRYTSGNLEEFIKNTILRGDENLLDQPNQNLLFLFDEYDQITDNVKIKRGIDTFIDNYPKSRYIITCRNNVYANEFDESNFSNYILEEFTREDIITYIDLSVGKNSSELFSQILSNNLLQISKNPFVLKNICEIFIEKHDLPSSSVKIFDKIIKILIDKDIRINRFQTQSPIDKNQLFTNLSYMATIMEMLRKNFLKLEDYNQVLSSPHNGIVKLSSLIKKDLIGDEEEFRFIHHSFQEFLVAYHLKDKPIKIIKNWITPFRVKSRRFRKLLASLLKPIDTSAVFFDKSSIQNFLNKNKKYLYYENQLNPSWIPVIKFLCELREEDDLWKYLLEIDKPEIILEIDKNNLQKDIRNDIFNAILTKYNDKGIIFDRFEIDINKLANFADKDYTINTVIDYALNKDNESIIYNMITILGYISEELPKNVIDFLIDTILDNNANDDIKMNCLYTLAKTGNNSDSIIKRVVDIKKSTSNYIQSGYFKLITSSPDFEKYESEIFDAISTFERTELLDLTSILKRGIEKIVNSNGIYNLLEFLLNHPETIRNYIIEESLPLIVNRATSKELDQDKIYKKLKDIIIELQKQYLLDDGKELCKYFIKTKTEFKLFSELFSTNFNEYEQIISLISNRDIIAFLVAENIKENLSDDSFGRFLHNLSFHNNEQYIHNIDFVREKTGKFKPIPPRDFNKDRMDGIKYYISLLFDLKSYKKEVEKIFNKIGSNKINKKSLNDLDEKTIYEDKEYDEYVYRDLVDIFNNNPKYNLTKEALLKIFVKSKFETFALRRSYDLLRHNKDLEINEEVKNSIRIICEKKAKEVNFRKAINKDGSVVIIAMVLNYFMNELQINYSSEIMIDMLLFDSYDSKYNYYGITHIENTLGSAILKKHILKNIQDGISDDRVLINHLDYCSRHGITDIINELIKIIYDDKRDIDTRKSCIFFLAKLDSDLSLLEKIMTIENQVIFKHAAELLLKNKNKSIQKILHSTIKGKGNDDLKLISAKLLLPHDKIAIEFLIDNIISTKKYHVRFHDEDYLSTINNIKSIPRIFELLKFAFEFESEIKQDRYNSIRAAIQNALRNMNLNDKNHNIIIKKLTKFISDYDKIYPNVRFLHIFIEELRRSYFLDNVQIISIDEAKEIVNPTFEIYS